MPEQRVDPAETTLRGESDMAQLDTQILPLLPLTSGVVLPGMVVTLTIESDEARRALVASESSGGELLLRAQDRLELREDRHRCQGGGRGPAAQRPRKPSSSAASSAPSSGPASPGPARPRGCSSNPVPTPTSPPSACSRSRANTGRSWRTSSKRAASPRSQTSSADCPTPVRSPTRPGIRPTCRSSGRSRSSRPSTSNSDSRRCWIGRRRSWPSSN